MHKCKCYRVRAALIPCIGDFYKRFPTLVEPHTHIFIKMLDDVYDVVRSNAVTVISHLILTKALKDVTAISSLAMLHNDQQPIILRTVNLFWKELVESSGSEEELMQKIIPDVLVRLSSRLSSGNNNAADRKSFLMICDFLFNLVANVSKTGKSKNSIKLINSLIEKICIRFKDSHYEIGQWRLFADCLLKLVEEPQNLSKLLSMSDYWKDKLVDPSIYDSFESIHSKNLRI